jgi:disease resistance protein RPS2
MDILTGAASNTTNVIIASLIQQIDDAIQFEDHRRLLEVQLNRVKVLLIDITDQFEYRRKNPPQSLRNSLQRMQDAVLKAKELIDRSQRPKNCIEFYFCRPKLSREIREWKEALNHLFDDLHKDFSVFCSAQQVASVTTQQAEMKLSSWVTEAPQTRIIGVYGSAGVGKTTLLRKMYDDYKVSNVFDDVLWVPVDQFPDLELQGRIASAVNLDLASCYNDIDMRRMRLAAYLKRKNFFLVLENMLRKLDLKELGVEFGNDKDSKLVFSTENRNLIEEMKADGCMKIQPMSTEDTWKLFSDVAFKDVQVPGEIEHIAKEVALECEGLPLAIKLIASAMMGNSSLNEWQLALRQMQRMDLNFPISRPPMDSVLFQRLRWSYDSLPQANLKNCFLYCAAFAEDEQIPVKALVHIWIAEGLLKAKDMDYLLNYVQLLENRCLFQVKGDIITVHHVVRSMAICLGENEENCVFRASQRLRHFPDIENQAVCKRLSVYDNNITSLPTKELRCPKLVSLFLGKNEELKEIPEGFFLNFTSLRVLELSIPVKSLPTSLWQLTHLEFLNLSWTEIEDISEDIGNLSSLQFLYLGYCRNLKALPSQVADLENMQYLYIKGCYNLREIPDEITCRIEQ